MSIYIWIDVSVRKGKGLINTYNRMKSELSLHTVDRVPRNIFYRS